MPIIKLEVIFMMSRPAHGSGRYSRCWTSVPTKDESRFQYESNQIYREAYNAAKAEIAAAQNGGEIAGFDVKA